MAGDGAGRRGGGGKSGGRGFQRVVGKLFYRCEWAALYGAGGPEHNHVDFIRIRCINGNGTDGNVLFLIAEPPHGGRSDRTRGVPTCRRSSVGRAPDGVSRYVAGPIPAVCTKPVRPNRTPRTSRRCGPAGAYTAVAQSAEQRARRKMQVQTLPAVPKEEGRSLWQWA